ncbi:ECF RNA polymerase sigma-E factor [Phycisphaerae bacterium RAS1]|nr:ECF RNA polymerase sigma-E factor [Phycisphaerae bacterium RAS1]
MPNVEHDDPALLQALRAGDEQAYELLVRTHGGRMLAVARRMLPSEDDAGEVVQEAFLSAFKAIGTFSGQSRISTWLHRITVNAALMRLRSRKSRPEQSIESLLPAFLTDGHQADPAVDWQRSDEAAAGREMRELVRNCIAKLPESYRIVLQLRDLDGLDTEETARLLGIEVNAVKTRLHRARQALRTLLDPYMRGAET